jgi:hypothetical protein
MRFGPFSLAGASAGQLSFKLWLLTEPIYDRFCVYAASDGANYHGSCTWGRTSGWQNVSVDLANVFDAGSLLGQPHVWLMLVFTADRELAIPEGAYVDDVVLRACMGGVCPAAASEAVDAARSLVWTPAIAAP